MDSRLWRSGYEAHTENEPVAAPLARCFKYTALELLWSIKLHAGTRHARRCRGWTARQRAHVIPLPEPSMKAESASLTACVHIRFGRGPAWPNSDSTIESKPNSNSFYHVRLGAPARRSSEIPPRNTLCVKCLVPGTPGSPRASPTSENHQRPAWDAPPHRRSTEIREIFMGSPRDALGSKTAVSHDRSLRSTHVRSSPKCAAH